MNGAMEIRVPDKIQAFAGSIVAEAEAFVIDREDKLKLSADILARIKLAEKELEKERKFLVQPLTDHTRNINERFKTVSEPLAKARDIITRKVITYNQEQEEKARQEQARLRREETLRLKKLEEEKKKLETNGIKLNLPETPPAEPIVVAPPEKTTAGIYSKMTIKKVPAFKLVDFSKVPDKYKKINEIAINQAARDGVKNIAGMEWYEREVVQNR